MRHTLRLRETVLILLLCFGPSPASVYGSVEAAQPEETPANTSPGITYGIEFDTNHRYVWRGVTYSGSPVVQPYVWLSSRGWTLFGWGNYENHRPTHAEQFHHLNETDWGLQYEKEIGNWTIQPNLQFYHYPQQPDSPSTGEASLSLSHPMGAVSVFTVHSFDFKEYPGSYFAEFGVSYDRELSKRASLSASIEVAMGSSNFNETYLGVTQSALNLVGATLSVTYPADSSWYLRPHVEWSSLLDQDLRRTMPNPTHFNIGLAFGWQH